MYPKFSLILILLFLSFAANAQIWDYSYTHYGKEDGLPSNTVYCMVEDKDGIMWIGTDAGLVRFDGSHFKTYTTADGLPSNDVFSLFCDSKNRVWVITMSPEISYVEHSILYNKSNCFFLTKVEFKYSEFVPIIEYNKSIYVISNNSKLEYYKIDSLNRVSYGLLSERGNYGHFYSGDTLYFSNGINTILFRGEECIRRYNKTSKNTINTNALIVSGEKLIYYNLTKSKLCVLKRSDLYSFNFIFTNDLIKKISKDKFIFIEGNGVSYITLENFKLKQTPLLKNLNVSNFINSSSGFWFSTLNKGIFRLRDDFLFNKSVTSINKRNYSAVKKIENYIITGDEDGFITLFNKQESVQFKLKDLTSNVFNKITSFDFFKRDLLISSDAGYYKFNIDLKIQTLVPLYIDKNKLARYSCKRVYGNKNNQAIILAFQGILREKSNKIVNNPKHFKRLYSYHSFQGKEIIGAEDGLYYLKNDSLIPYPLNIPFHVRVMEITSKDSFLIVATINKGIFVINNHHVVANIDKSVGLSSNCCFRIKHYKDNLVIATNNGINFYNYTKHSIGKVFESDGLASNVVNDIDIDADTLYAATENGLSSIIIPEINFNKNFTIFSKPTIINRDSIWTKDSVFHTRTNYAFNFMLHSLTFGTKGNVKFYYQVDNPNVENGFIETSDQFIRFKFPKPGLYPINIYAKDVNDNISKQLKFMVYVDPYFSQTKTYYVVLIFTALVISSILYYAIYRYMKFRDGMQGVQKELIQKLQLKSWQSQMNPHYLFNSLNALQYMFLSSDAEQAKDFMMNFSTMLRKTIDQSKQMFTTVEIEIQYIEGYLNLEREKRKQPFDYQIIVSNQSIYKLNIPTLLIQPVLENSIKHGINFRADGLIMIHFSIENDCLTVSIQDNGSGLQPKPHNTEHQSIGLKLIQDKIEIVENYIQDKIFYSLDNKIENGKVIGAITIFKFPLNLHNK